MILERQKRELSFGGGARPDGFAARCALEKAGIFVDIVCDFGQPLNMKSAIMEIRNWKELLDESDQYFFIIAEKAPFMRHEIMKRLAYAGVDEYGVVFEGYTKDFQNRKALQSALYGSINEVFGDIDFINHWGDLENCRRHSLEGMGYWDVPFIWIYNMYKKAKQEVKYFEIGPGNGIMSLGLKKLVPQLDVTWLNIPHEEQQWKEWRRASVKKVLNKYNIHTMEGFIELDEISGSFDIIVMAQVMEHLVFNPVNTFSKLRGLLREGGYICVSVPQEKVHYNVSHYSEMPNPWDMTKEEIQRRIAINVWGHFHEYSYEEAMEVFEESGLECAGYLFTYPIHHFILTEKTTDNRGNEER